MYVRKPVPLRGINKYSSDLKLALVPNLYSYLTMSKTSKLFFSCLASLIAILTLSSCSEPICMDCHGPLIIGDDYPDPDSFAIEDEGDGKITITYGSNDFLPTTNLYWALDKAKDHCGNLDKSASVYSASLKNKKTVLEFDCIEFSVEINTDKIETEQKSPEKIILRYESNFNTTADNFLKASGTAHQHCKSFEKISFISEVKLDTKSTHLIFICADEPFRDERLVQ